MRTIEYTTQFKRDYKREIKGKHKAVFGNLFVEIINTLARDEPLAAKHRDHALSNNWQDHRYTQRQCVFGFPSSRIRRSRPR